MKGRRDITGPIMFVLMTFYLVAVEIYVFSVCSVCYSLGTDSVLNLYIFNRFFDFCSLCKLQKFIASSLLLLPFLLLLFATRFLPLAITLTDFGASLS